MTETSWNNHEDSAAEQLRRQLLRQEEEIKLLKQMVAVENKEKYDAYKRIKELTEQLNKKD